MNFCKEENRKIALTGTCFKHILEKNNSDKKLLQVLLSKVKIFARSSAKQKKIIVELFKEKNKNDMSYVAFIGDGSNDALAVKAANISISIGSVLSSF